MTKRTWLLLGLWLAACGDPAGVDAGGVDAGDADGGGVDAGDVDAGDVDAGEPPDGGSASCGDGVVSGAELCDGPVVDCASLSGRWASGRAPCRVSCDGYDVSTCVAAPERVWELVKPAERDDRWSNARCNDGTPFDFLYKPGAADNDVWVIFLQGGGFGDDVAFPTVDRPPLLTGTTAVDDGVRGPVPMLERGIFGGPALNPDFHGAHMIFAHYCSSDLYSGRGTERRPVAGVPEGFYFAGRHNIRAMFEILVQRYGLDDADPDVRVLYGGESAGNIGSAQTADIAVDLLPTLTADRRLRYFADGAYVVAPADDATEQFWGASTLNDVELFNGAITYWDAEPLPTCPSTERGECYLGRGWYPGIVALGLPVVVAMSNHDEVVLGLRGICTESCGGAGRVCFEGCMSLTTEQYATIRADYRADWADVGVEWLFAWGSTEHTAALVDNRWNGPPGASEPLRGLVADFFFDRTEARTVFVNGADR